MLTLKYRASGGGARGGYIGNAEDEKAGCVLTITTEPDLGNTRSADISGPAGEPDDAVDILDLATFVSYWLESSHP